MGYESSSSSFWVSNLSSSRRPVQCIINNCPRGVDTPASRDRKVDTCVAPTSSCYHSPTTPASVRLFIAPCNQYAYRQNTTRIGSTPLIVASSKTTSTSITILHLCTRVIDLASDQLCLALPRNDRIVELYVIDEIKMHRCHHFLAMHLIVLAIDSSESTK